jgi:hypothetical protein
MMAARSERSEAASDDMITPSASQSSSLVIPYPSRNSGPSSNIRIISSANSSSLVHVGDDEDAIAAERPVTKITHTHIHGAYLEVLDDEYDVTNS